LLIYGSFTLAKFVSKAVSESDTKQYLPWLPWEAQQEIETILSMSCRPRWQRQVLFCVAGTGVITHTLPMETQLYISKDISIVTGKNTSDS
jgi:hypothetical protein